MPPIKRAPFTLQAWLRGPAPVRSLSDPYTLRPAHSHKTWNGFVFSEKTKEYKLSKNFPGDHQTRS